MMDRRRALMMGPPPTFYINGYVGNGMIHYWDGIDNSGIGQPRKTSGFPWVDIVGDCNINRSYSNSPYYGNKYISLGSPGTSPGSAQQGWRSAPSYTSAYCLLGLKTGFSVQIRFNCVYGRLGLEEYATLFCAQQAFRVDYQASTGTIRFLQYRNSSATRNFTYVTNNVQPMTLTICYSFSDNYIYLYVNGILCVEYDGASNKSDYDAQLSKGNSTLFGGNQISGPANGLWLNGYIYNTLLYDRPLNQNEIVANYQNDLTRFAS